MKKHGKRCLSIMLNIKEAADIINGVYLAINKNDQELLLKTVNKVEEGLLNPFFKAFIGFKRVDTKIVNKCLKLTAEFLNKYYGKAPIDNTTQESDEFWSECVESEDDIYKVICNYDEENRDIRDYIAGILLASIKLVESECSQRRNNDSLKESGK